jgi:hypothetical protein
MASWPEEWQDVFPVFAIGTKFFGKTPSPRTRPSKNKWKITFSLEPHSRRYSEMTTNYEDPMRKEPADDPATQIVS